MKKASALATFLIVCLTSNAQFTMVSSYTEDFNSIGTSLPTGWGVWTSSTTTSNGDAFTWSTTQIANNGGANSSTYFRNLPGASQSWSAGLSSGTDRAIGWRAGSAASRNGSITFTISNTSNWTFQSLSFKLFTPNNTGTAATFDLEYQIGSGGTFTHLANKSYTNDTAQNPLTVTSVTLTSGELAPLNDQSGQVTLRLNNTATSGTSWETLAIDDFSLTASAVPEPSSFAALAGLAMLVFVASRRRTRATLA